MIKSIKQKGFTIVETMIVLAIVGAIMLVVFLAVPALQRNSRNTGLRSDVANVLAAVNEFITNNNGKMPDDGTSVSGLVTISSTAAGTSSVQTNIRGSTSLSKGTAAPTATDSIVLVFKSKCNGNALATGVGTFARATAALFLVEGASTTTLQCQET